MKTLETRGTWPICCGRKIVQVPALGVEQEAARDLVRALGPQ